MPEANISVIPGVSISLPIGGGSDALNFTDFIDSLKGGLDGVSSYLSDLIWQRTNNTTDTVDFYGGKILADLEFNTDLISRQIDGVENNVINTILEGIFANHTANKRIEERITESITRQVLGSENVITKTIGEIARSIDNSTGSILRDVLGMGDKINIGFESVLADTGDLLDILTRGITANIENNIILPPEIFDVTLENINTAIHEVIEGNKHTVDVLGNTVAAAVIQQSQIEVLVEEEQTGVLEKIGSQVEDIGEQTLEHYRHAFLFWKEVLADIVGGVVGEDGEINLDSIPDVLKIGIKDVLFSDPPIKGADRDCESVAIDSGLLEKTGIKIYDWFIALITLTMLPMNMAQVRANREIQDYRICYPDQLPSPGDVGSMYHRKLLTETEALTMLRQSGFQKAHAERLLESARSFPPLEWLFTLYFRDLASEGATRSALNAMGFLDGWDDAMMEAAYFIPPVSDLITMLVREVFDPKTTAKFGQFEDYPELFTSLAKQQGVSEEWAKNYWAAHWSLPSVQMGYEMLHRGEITEDELEQLMKAQDIMPFWRKPLLAISYNPLTRVDVRRMHALGVIDEKQVDKAYRDLGYNAENAKLMTDFTVKYNEGESDGLLNLSSDLTRSNIIGFFSDDVITREEAHALLLQDGVNPIASELFLRSEEANKERKDRRVKIDIILDRIPTGKATLEEAQRQLEQIGLAPLELERAQQDAIMIADKQHKTPSRADLDKFIKVSLITDTEYYDGMRRLGYDDFWIAKYFSLAIGGIDEG